jgi:hypothetical protein
MEIKKLNCASCGAPISIPEDVDFINCTSCGSYLSVQRGEGYIALRMVKEVADTIKKTSSETQSAIRDGTYATKTELQKLQLAQEISTVEMQLSSLQGEIRGVERSIQPGATNYDANYRITKQLQDLHLQEYGIYVRLYNLHKDLSAHNSINPENDPGEIEKSLSIVNSAIMAIRNADQGRADVRNALNSQRNFAEQLKQNLLQIKIQNLKTKLPSSRLEIQSATDASTALANYSLIVKDIQQLEQMPKTPERDILLKECHNKRDGFQNQWRQLETQSVQSHALSLNLPSPKDLDITQLQANLAQIQNEIHTLSSWQENDISRAFLKDLSKKEKNYKKALLKAEGKTPEPSGCVGWLASIGLFFQSVWEGLTKKSDSAVQPASQPEIALENQGAPLRTVNGKRVVIGIGLGSLILFSVTCVGTVIGFILFPQVDNNPGPTAGIFCLSTFLGYVGAIFVFFIFAKSLFVKPIVKSIVLALVTLFGGALLSFTIGLFFPTGSEIGTNIAIVGIFCVTPLVTFVVFILSMVFPRKK